MRARWGWFLVIPLLLCLGLTAATQFAFLGKSFFKELGLGLTGPFVGIDNFVTVMRSPLYRHAIVTTLSVSAWATLGCVVLAYPVAYTIARMASRWSVVMLTAVLLASLVTAPIKVLGLIIIFGKESGLNRLMIASGLIDHPVSILGNQVGVVVGLMYYSLAFAVLLLYSVIRTIPYSLQEAAEIHGCSHWRALRRVVIPLTAPGIVSVSLTIFSLSMGAFASTALMGAGKVPTLPVIIYQTVFIATKYATASTLAMILLGMVVLVNVLAVILLPRLFASTTAAPLTKAHNSPPRQLVTERLTDAIRVGRVRFSAHVARVDDRLRRAGVVVRPSRILTAIGIGMVYLFLFAPLLVIVGASFNGGSSRSGAIIFPPRHFSWDWYAAIPAEHLWSAALSVLLATFATGLSCLIAVPAALGLVRSTVRGRELAAAAFRIPLQIPVVIVGLSFYAAYFLFDDATGASLEGSFTGLVVAHLFVLTPYVIGSVMPVLQRFDDRLEEAASSLGAGRWRTFRRVTLPVIAPGVFAGAVYAFMVSFGDVPISLFLAGPDTVTFPVAIFHSMELDFDATVLASSTLVMVLGGVLLLIVQRVIGLDTIARSNAGARG